MVSSEEIRRRLESKRKGANIQGYLEYEKCVGYYELQQGESPNDYEECYSGGNLKYSDFLMDIIIRIVTITLLD